MMQIGRARTAKSYIDQNYFKCFDGRLEKKIGIVPYHIYYDPVNEKLTYSIESGKEEPRTMGKLLFQRIYDDEKTRLFKLGAIK